MLGKDEGMLGRLRGILGKDEGTLGKDGGTLGKDEGMLGKDGGTLGKDGGTLGRLRGILLLHKTRDSMRDKSFTEDMRTATSSETAIAAGRALMLLTRDTYRWTEHAAVSLPGPGE